MDAAETTKRILAYRRGVTSKDEKAEEDLDQRAERAAEQQPRLRLVRGGGDE